MERRSISKMGGALKDELQQMPGFISVERFASVNNEGKFLSLSFGKAKKLRQDGATR